MKKPTSIVTDPAPSSSASPRGAQPRDFWSFVDQATLEDPLSPLTRVGRHAHRQALDSRVQNSTATRMQTSGALRPETPNPVANSPLSPFLTDFTAFAHAHLHVQTLNHEITALDHSITAAIQEPRNALRIMDSRDLVRTLTLIETIRNETESVITRSECNLTHASLILRVQAGSTLAQSLSSEALSQICGLKRSHEKHLCMEQRHIAAQAAQNIRSIVERFALSEGSAHPLTRALNESRSLTQSLTRKAEDLRRLLDTEIQQHQSLCDLVSALGRAATIGPRLRTNLPVSRSELQIASLLETRLDEALQNQTERSPVMWIDHVHALESENVATRFYSNVKHWQKTWQHNCLAHALEIVLEGLRRWNHWYLKNETMRPALLSQPWIHKEALAYVGELANLEEKASETEAACAGLLKTSQALLQKAKKAEAKWELLSSWVTAFVNETIVQLQVNELQRTLALVCTLRGRLSALVPSELVSTPGTEAPGRRHISQLLAEIERNDVVARFLAEQSFQQKLIRSGLDHT